ncbi:hypothetical protein ADUPG1_008938 [Aduncisulcus paluster]|uniref:TRP C-terminal domain-containing protein n=1 Tax=Aduncisulcus paluster TaxID=2918883 RepID=A0ABQ5KTS7_9EUKA|nr:hypothetical protein ADUPG1_008938 [Aduncisulcus paluster]
MEPTVALSEDGIFVTVATSSDDDTFNSSAISPIFYQYDSSLSSAAHSVEQNISIAAIKEDTHGWAFIKLYGNEMNAYRLSLYLDTCNIDSALQVSGDNAFRAMCITCNGPSTYKGVYETGALCHPCPDGANCHNGGSIGSDSGYWTWLDADTGAIVLRSDGTVIHHECPIDGMCVGSEALLEANDYVMTPELIDGACEEGHGGLMCLSCDSSWVRGQVNDSCEECGNAVFTAFTFGGLLTIQIVFTIYACLSVAKDLTDDEDEEGEEEEEEEEERDGEVQNINIESPDQPIHSESIVTSASAPCIAKPVRSDGSISPLPVGMSPCVSVSELSLYIESQEIENTISSRPILRSSSSLRSTSSSLKSSSSLLVMQPSTGRLTPLSRASVAVAYGDSSESESIQTTSVDHVDGSKVDVSTVEQITNKRRRRKEEEEGMERGEEEEEEEEEQMEEVGEEEEEEEEEDEDDKMLSVATCLSLLLCHWQILIGAPWSINFGILTLDCIDLTPQLFSVGIMCLFPNSFTPFLMTLLNMLWPTLFIIFSLCGMAKIMAKLSSMFSVFDASILFSILCELFLMISTESAAYVFRVFKLGNPSGSDPTQSEYIWLYDPNIRLSDFQWKLLCYVAIAIFIFNFIFVPLFVSLCAWKKHQVGRSLPIMEGLKDGFTWFLIGLLLFRQLLQILIEVVDGGTIQIFGTAIVLVLFRIIFWKYSPFEEDSENQMTIWSFDILALSYLTLGLGEVLSSNSSGRWVFMVFAGLTIVFNVVFLVAMMLAMSVTGRKKIAKKLKGVILALKTKLMKGEGEEEEEEEETEGKDKVPSNDGKMDENEEISSSDAIKELQSEQSLRRGSLKQSKGDRWKKLPPLELSNE